VKGGNDFKDEEEGINTRKENNEKGKDRKGRKKSREGSKASKNTRK